MHRPARIDHGRFVRIRKRWLNLSPYPPVSHLSVRASRRPLPAHPGVRVGFSSRNGMASDFKSSRTAPASVSTRRVGPDYTARLPTMAEAFGKLPAPSATLDGELVLINPRGGAHFYRLMREMRTSHPDEAQLMFLAFDLLHQHGVDLRSLPLSERKRDLKRLCRKSRVPFLSQVEQFPDGDTLLDYCNRFGFEGICASMSSMISRAVTLLLG
jgi:ATP dependent DNA ligase domain